MRIKLELPAERVRTDVSDEEGRPVVRVPLDLLIVNDWHGWIDRFRLGYIIPWDSDDLPVSLRSKIATREGEGAQHMPADLAIAPFDTVHHEFAVWYPRYTQAGNLQVAVYLTDGEHVRWYRLVVDYQARDQAVVTSALFEADGRIAVAFTPR